MATLVKFVDSIAASPGVRLDLSDQTTWRAQAGTDLGMPPVKRAVVSTLLTDGAIVPAAAYDNRELHLELLLQAASSDVVATELQKLARELDRPTNFLLWQPGTTNPVFFRTFQSPLDSLSHIGSSETGNVFVNITVLAEPFAYGLKETLSQVTVTNDPAAGSNGMFFDVAAPKGDVETPLHLVVGNTVISGSQFSSVFATRRRGTVTNLPLSLQAETMTVGTDTSVQVNDAAMSGAGSNYVRCTFATVTALQNRVSTTAYPAAASVDNRGRYRMYARMRHSVAGDVITVRPLFGGLTYGDIVTLPNSTSLFWIDLGDFTLPYGPDPVADGYSGVEVACAGIPLSIDMGRTSGTGNVDLDVLLFVPQDDPPLLVKWAQVSGPTDFILDGGDAMVYARDGSGNIRQAQVAQLVGRPPMLTPGRTNRVVFALSVGSPGGADVKTNTVTFTPYYWPRYLYVKPVST